MLHHEIHNVDGGPAIHDDAVGKTLLDRLENLDIVREPRHRHVHCVDACARARGLYT